MTRSRRLLVAVTFAGLACCSSVGEYVWVDKYVEPAAQSHDVYLIAPGDLINVRVWNQESMSARVRVRPDGRVSLPFLNDVTAAGLEPPTLARDLQSRLKELIVKPVVSVAVEEAAPLEVSVVGEVSKPGVYRMENAGVLNAIASAGGLTQYADRDRIFVLRRPPSDKADAAPTRIRFTYEALSRVEGVAARFRLRKGDVVVVE
jgi:polysaccharide export outer membrane protein